MAAKLRLRFLHGVALLLLCAPRQRILANSAKSSLLLFRQSGERGVSSQAAGFLHRHVKAIGEILPDQRFLATAT